MANTNIAAQLAKAVKHHQNNEAETREVRKRVDKFEAMIAVLDEHLGLVPETERDIASASAGPKQMERP